MEQPPNRFPTKSGYRLWMAQSLLVLVVVLLPLGMIFGSLTAPNTWLAARVVLAPLSAVLMVAGVRYARRQWSDPPWWTVITTPYDDAP